MKLNFFTWPWIFAALLIRFFASWTHSSWFHPDEWFQTIEWANLIDKGFAYYSQEISLHLRNLTWPLLLTLPLKVAHFIDPGSVDLRIFCFEFFCGLLDLGILWGWIQLLKTELPLNWTWQRRRWIYAIALTLWTLPWFTVYDSISPRAEHVSAIATWIALGALARKQNFVSGLASVLIIAIRPASGLFSLGIFLVLPKDQRRGFIGGAVAGAILFGIPDWIFYGRPWESLWMYLQYNIFTGLSSEIFGSQHPSAYWEFFDWRWGRYSLNILLGIVLIPLALIGLGTGLRQKKPWAWGLFLYCLGHLWVAHKEARFILPVESVLLWSGVWGGVQLFARSKTSFKIPTPARRLAWGVVSLYFGANFLLLLRAIWGETWVPAGTYREVSRHLRSSPKVCAIVTPKFPMSPLVPHLNSEGRLEPALGFTGTSRDSANFRDIHRFAIDWQENNPQCARGSSVLVHTQRPDPEWNSQNCELLASGVLGVLPRSTWPWALEKNLASGSWYRCTPEILKQFKSTSSVSHRIIRWDEQNPPWPRFASLPPFGISGAELIQLAIKTTPPPMGAENFELFKGLLTPLPPKND